TMGMKLSYYNNTAAGTQIYADPEQLKRVIYNIVNNATKYARQTPSTLHVRIEETLPENPPPPLYRQLSKDGSDLKPLEKPPEYIRIQIEDEGPGIPAQDLPHIFDRFYRADTSRSSSTGGSGLGLSIVRKIITDHGGHVWAESIEGVGTSINFALKKMHRKEDTNE
ncbi:MAG: sensor histidine kinase, partial [Lachnospiraceae bacterium]|nr:sensor histidine kinase [Lachnospiraceae bacterium]